MAEFCHQHNTFRTFPLGIGLVAAYAAQCLGGRYRLFKFADDLLAAMKHESPAVAAFSNTVWNTRLSHAVITRLKRLHPRTVIVMGGPDYPLEPAKQEAFLRDHPLVDFYIVGEGELPFVALLEQLRAVEMDAGALKAAGVAIPGCHYVHGERFIAPPPGSRLTDLDSIPSPYLTGLFDDLFPAGLSPMLQFARGCPFSCTFCTEGKWYHNRINHVGVARFEADLQSIARRITDPELVLYLADSNFGMFPAYIDACRAIRRTQEAFGWPRRIDTSMGKNRLATIQAAVDQLLPGTIWHTASVQSTDPGVLARVKRRNLPSEQLFAAAREAEKFDCASQSEIILNLPGDSRAAHYHSLREVMEHGIARLRLYNTLVLKGSELETSRERERHGLKTGFRILPRNFGHYGEEGFPMAEIGEIITASATMPYEEYLDCRLIDLSVEIFYNDHYFPEVEGLLGVLGVSIFDFVQACHGLLEQFPPGLRGVYDGFLAMVKRELWDSPAAIDAFFLAGDNLIRYAETEHENSLATNRAVALLSSVDGVHAVAEQGLRRVLTERGLLTPGLSDYVAEMVRFSLMRKGDWLSGGECHGEFRYDFRQLADTGFSSVPPPTAPRRYRFWHDPELVAAIQRRYRAKSNPAAAMRHVFYYSLSANPVDFYFRRFNEV